MANGTSNGNSSTNGSSVLLPVIENPKVKARVVKEGEVNHTVTRILPKDKVVFENKSTTKDKKEVFVKTTVDWTGCSRSTLLEHATKNFIIQKVRPMYYRKTLAKDTPLEITIVVREVKVTKRGMTPAEKADAQFKALSVEDKVVFLMEKGLDEKTARSIAKK